jgi:hypothetical protein
MQEAMNIENQPLAPLPQRRGITSLYSHFIYILGIYYPILRRAIIGA